MEGHCECLRYLVSQLLEAEASLSPSSDVTHRVLDAGNNLGQNPRLLAQHFHKYHIIEAIDSLQSQPTKSTDDDGTSARSSFALFCRFITVLLFYNDICLNQMVVVIT